MLEEEPAWLRGLANSGMEVGIKGGLIRATRIKLSHQTPGVITSRKPHMTLGAELSCHSHLWVQKPSHREAK